MKKIIIVTAVIAILATLVYFLHIENARIDKENIEEIVLIEKNIKQHKIYPERETIDRLYRYRNSVDSKYSFEGPSKEFCDVYDRVIKPL